MDPRAWREKWRYNTLEGVINCSSWGLLGTHLDRHPSPVGSIHLTKMPGSRDAWEFDLVTKEVELCGDYSTSQIIAQTQDRSPKLRYCNSFGLYHTSQLSKRGRLNHADRSVCLLKSEMKSWKGRLCSLFVDCFSFFLHIHQLCVTQQWTAVKTHCGIWKQF